MAEILRSLANLPCEARSHAAIGSTVDKVLRWQRPLPHRPYLRRPLRRSRRAWRPRPWCRRQRRQSRRQSYRRSWRTRTTMGRCHAGKLVRPRWEFWSRFTRWSPSQASANLRPPKPGKFSRISGALPQRLRRTTRGGRGDAARHHGTPRGTLADSLVSPCLPLAWPDASAARLAKSASCLLAPSTRHTCAPLPTRCPFACPRASRPFVCAGLETRRELSRKLNVSARQVQVWFQNKRQRERKLSRAKGMLSTPGLPDTPAVAAAHAKLELHSGLSGE